MIYDTDKDSNKDVRILKDNSFLFISCKLCIHAVTAVFLPALNLAKILGSFTASKQLGPGVQGRGALSHCYTEVIILSVK